MNDFIVVSKDWPENDFDKHHLQFFSKGFNQPKCGQIFEEIGRKVVDVIELTIDYPKMLGEVILRHVAKVNKYPYYVIVEDSQIFDEGLLLLGYKTEEAMKGITDDNEIGSECLDLAELKQNRVYFDDGSEYDMDLYCKDRQLGLKGKYLEKVYLFPFKDEYSPKMELQSLEAVS